MNAAALNKKRTVMLKVIFFVFFGVALTACDRKEDRLKLSIEIIGDDIPSFRLASRDTSGVRFASCSENSNMIGQEVSCDGKNILTIKRVKNEDGWRLVYECNRLLPVNYVDTKWRLMRTDDLVVIKAINNSGSLIFRKK